MKLQPTLQTSLRIKKAKKYTIRATQILIFNEQTINKRKSEITACSNLCFININLCTTNRTPSTNLPNKSPPISWTQTLLKS